MEILRRMGNRKEEEKKEKQKWGKRRSEMVEEEERVKNRELAETMSCLIMDHQKMEEKKEREETEMNYE